MDLIVNVVLTLSFIIPIAKSRFPKARKLAQRSAAAAMISLATSFVNIIVLSIMHGKQLSFVCLGACGLDVTINAAMLFVVSPLPSSHPAKLTRDKQGDEWREDINVRS